MWRSWLASLLRRGRLEREMDTELAAHIEACADDLGARGVPRREAERRARLEFGSVAAVKEECREALGLQLVDIARRDLSYAVRALHKSPTFTVTAVAVVALCIGANTAVFSVVDAVLLRPLPYAEPEQLAKVITTLVSGSGAQEFTRQTGREWEALRGLVETLDAAAFSESPMLVKVAHAGQAADIPQQRVSAGFFRVLGVDPLMGRGFSEDEDRPGGATATVLGHELWRTTFLGDTSLLGRDILIRGKPHAVVGVMPPGFRTSVPAGLWTPLRPSTSGEGRGQNYSVFARLRPGVSRARAASEVARASAEIFESVRLPPDTSVSSSLVPLQRGLTRGLRRPLLMLWGFAGIVLLIGCVNVAGLLLARNAGRCHEVATRMALGGGRAAIVRQLLTESLLLASLGGLAGLALGYLALGRLGGVLADSYGIWQRVELDSRVFAVMVGACLSTSALFGTLPAVQASRIDIRRTLLERGPRQAASAWARWPHRALVVGEIALGVVLLVGASLLLRTFAYLSNLSPGFDPAHVMTASVSLHEPRFASNARVGRLFEETLGRIRDLPGVESAAVGLNLPYERGASVGFRFADSPHIADEMTNLTYVTPGYFGVLNVPLVRGRVFDPRDHLNGQKVLLVNQAFAAAYSAERDLVGSSITVAFESRRIVGVVGDVLRRGDGWGGHGPLATLPTVYVPAAQASDQFLGLAHTWATPSWVVRTSGGGPSTAADIRRAFVSVDPQLTISGLRSMRDVMSHSLSEQRLQTTLIGIFAGVALLLAAVGLYGLIAQSVVEQTHELGVRLALGATPWETVRAAAAPGLVLASAGVVAGVLLARLGVLAMRHVIWGVPPGDPVTFLAVALGALLVVSLASLLPALRVSRLDPARTLRAE